MLKILMHARPCIHNTAGAFSCNFPYSLAALQNFLTLFFSSIPIVIELWELKIKSKYAKQYLFWKIMEMYFFQATELAFEFISTRYANYGWK